MQDWSSLELSFQEGCVPCVLDFGGSTLKVIVAKANCKVTTLKSAHCERGDNPSNTAEKRVKAEGKVKETTDENHNEHRYRLDTERFPSTQSGLDSALEYLKQHCDFSNTTEKTGSSTLKLYATGINCSVHEDKIVKTLGVKLHLLHELPCVLRGFRHVLSTLPCGRLLHAVPARVYRDIAAANLTASEGARAFHKNIGVPRKGDLLPGIRDLDFWLNYNVDPIADDSLPMVQAVHADTLFPCMITMLGSSLVNLTLECDGQALSGPGFSPSCGKTLMGLASLLTNCQTFEDLIELASHGDSRALDVTAADQAGLAGADDSTDDSKDKHHQESTGRSSSEEDQVVTSPAEGQQAYNDILQAISKTVICSFGKAPGSSLDMWKKEDLARALLRKLLDDIASEVMLAVSSSGIKRVFFCGSMVDSEFLRTEMIYTLGTKWAIHPQVQAKYHFVQNGGHLSALGTLLHACHQT